LPIHKLNVWLIILFFSYQEYCSTHIMLLSIPFLSKSEQEMLEAFIWTCD